MPLGGCPRTAQKPASTQAATAPAPLLPAVTAWTIPLPAKPSAGGVGDEERLYVPLQSNRLVALSLESGEQMWESKDEISTAHPPLASGRSLFVATATALLELDAATGVTERRVALTAPPAGPMTRAGDLLLVPQEPDSVEAIRLADGARAWRVTLDAPARSVAAVGRDNAAYFSLGDGSLAAVSLSAGKILWAVRDLGTLSPAVASGNRVLVGSTDTSSKTLFAFNARSGAESWRLTTVGDVVGAAAAGALVYFVSKDNVVKAVSRDSGNQRWLTTMTTRPLLPPRVIDDQILVVGVSPLLALFDAKTGMAAGTYTLSGDLEGAILEGEPILAGGRPDGSGHRLILITRDGRVLTLRPGSDKTQRDPGSEHGDKSSEPERTPAKPDSTIDR